MLGSAILITVGEGKGRGAIELHGGKSARRTDEGVPARLVPRGFVLCRIQCEREPRRERMPALAAGQAPLGGLSAQTAGRARLGQAPQLLLRAGRVPPASYPSIGAFPGTQGIRRLRGGAPVLLTAMR